MSSGDDDPGISDPELRAMRAVWLSMRDEDPPERGLADLLVAARAKAEAARPVPWWRRALATLRRPPVMALATVVVLLGGALALGRREAAVQAPTIAAPEPSEPTTLAPEPERVHEEAAPPALERAPAPRPAPAHHAAPRDDEAPDRDQGAARAGTGGGPAAAMAAPVRDEAPDKATAAPSASAPARAQFDVGEAVSADLPSAEPRGPSAEQLFKQCESAAARGDCAAVRALVEKLEKLDGGYRSRVPKDSAIARCLP